MKKDNSFDLFVDFVKAVKKNPIEAFRTAASGVFASDAACRFVRYSSAIVLLASTTLVGTGTATEQYAATAIGLWCGAKELSRLYSFGAEQAEHDNDINNEIAVAVRGAGSARRDDIPMAPA